MANRDTQFINNFLCLNHKPSVGGHRADFIMHLGFFFPFLLKYTGSTTYTHIYTDVPIIKNFNVSLHHNFLYTLHES